VQTSMIKILSPQVFKIPYQVLYSEHRVHIVWMLGNIEWISQKKTKIVNRFFFSYFNIRKNCMPTMPFMHYLCINHPLADCIFDFAVIFSQTTTQHTIIPVNNCSVKGRTVHKIWIFNDKKWFYYTFNFRNLYQKIIRFPWHSGCIKLPQTAYACKNSTF
jgi:hypothetical protein